ncbi:MAG: NmrA family NAD(P)-binding protein [Anaerolineales bacterium]
MILVTGAAGKTGRAVLRALGRYGFEVRALVKTPDHADHLPALDRLQIVVGDMLDAGAVRRATAGASAIYHIPPNMHPAELEMADVLLTAARESGIRRLIYHSVLHPQLPSMPHHWRKLEVETRVLESGLPFTILQPAAYMQNLLNGWRKIQEEGIYQVPYPISTRLQLVDLIDVAEVAARVVSQPGYTDAIFELCGPSAPTQRQVADQLSMALGRPVTVEQIDHESWRRQAERTGMSAERIEDFLAMFRHYEHHHFLGNPRTLTALLGRRPTDLDSFLERVIASPGPDDSLQGERSDHG